MSRAYRPALLGALAAFGLVWGPPARAQEQVASSLASQQEEQRRIQRETEETAKRIESMLRVITFHQLEQPAEKKFLAKTAQTLSSLSREQMTAVIEHLEKAVKSVRAVTGVLDVERQAVAR